MVSWSNVGFEFTIGQRCKDVIVCLGSGVLAYLFNASGNTELAGVCIGVFGSYALKNGYKAIK